MEKTYYFIFNDDCFDRNSQRSNIARQKRPYNKTIYDMNKAVEELDRYDDFDSLKIDAAKYEKTEKTVDYGIMLDRTKHADNSVILKHQKAAALSFLKDLRGFGLLADVVGSGKTFEASVILSELAVRGKIKSMLLVVPGQVYDSWVNVLELQFGLGTSVLFEAGEDFKSMSDFKSSTLTFDEQNRPSRPIIVKTEDFVNWDNDLSTLLFDVIVVDEAHHLCKEDGEYAKAMKLLSMMMATKKRANVTYCLLLSATPHSGNLVHMFRLWYFVRCRGGNPEDFDEKEDINRSEEYNREKAYYIERVCRGATTVMEFIKNVKSSEVLLNYADELFKFAAKDGMTREKFYAATKGEQQRIIDDFLAEPDNFDIQDRVMHNVASAYHNGVLRSIMIRQPSTSLISKEKQQINYLFYPADKNKQGTITVKDWYKKNSLKVNLSKLTLGDDACITPLDDDNAPGHTVSLKEYVEENHQDVPEGMFHSDIICSVFENTVDVSAFEKKDFQIYYREQMRYCQDNKMRCMIKPVYEKDDLFTAKYEQTKELLRKHSKQRVLIFFDYELKKSELMHGKFEKAILADDEFKDRVIIGTANNKEKTLEIFNEKDDAILVVKDASFTEGVNLQLSNIIINFQVTPDPLSMDQRIGRIFRLGQKNNVIIYSLANMHKLEGFALMYFTRIGLMSSNSGDATIIAGSNNERMVAVQCDRCGKVALYSQEDYEFYKKSEDGLICNDGPECVGPDRPKGTEMKEISVYDFKCDKCSTVFARSVADESGYLCISNSTTGRNIMCNSGDKGDRRLYCRKICAMANCSRFRPGECAAVEAYRRDKSIGDQDLYMLCNRCPSKSRCPEKCRPYIGADGVMACSTCQYATCRPKPHVIEFDDRWEADCPVCKMMGGNKKGRIRPVVARTFAAYLRASWDFTHDGGKAFCNNLLNEANKVSDIKMVLDADTKE